MQYQNHFIDPTFFWDAIDEASFTYDIYINTKRTINDYGKTVFEYEKTKIRGSLQSQGRRWQQNLQGGTTAMIYKFYCKSLYRISEGDIIEYKGRYLLCKDIQDYDEHGVRECTLEMKDLTSLRELRDYFAYLEGTKLV